MPRLTKRQERSFEAVLAKLAKANGKDIQEYKDEVTLYSFEDYIYEAQAVYNFYDSRIEPCLRKDEKVEDFDRRAREWRIRVCRGCEEEFAYAFHYDGVSHCSLNCLEKSLERIGIKFSRHHDLQRRWGSKHPAIVPATSFAALKSVYLESAPNAFDPSLSDHPNSHVHQIQERNSNTAC